MTLGFGSKWRDKISDEKDRFDLAELFRRSSDSFDNIITESSQNIIDQPATVPSNRERHRYYVDTGDGSGYSRVNNPIEDNTSSFQDNPNHFLISCPAGERREFRTAEKATYRSGYESEWGMSWQLAEQLGENQVVRVRLIDSDREDGVVAEYRKNNGEIEAEYYLQQASGKINSTAQETYSPDGVLTEPRITKGFSSFYAVGEHRLEESTLKNLNNGFNVSQENNTKAIIGNQDDWSVESFNFHLSIEVDCLNSTNSLDVELGTMNYKARTTSPKTQRQKEFRIIDQPYNDDNGNYEPAFAFRIDPARDQVETDIPGTELSAQSGSAGEAVVVAVFENEVTLNQNGGSWDTPPQLAANDSILQYTEDVTQITDETGTLVADIPQVNKNMRSISLSSTSGRKSTSAGNAETIKSPLHHDEIGVVLLKTDTNNTAEDFNVRIISEENW